MGTDDIVQGGAPIQEEPIPPPPPHNTQQKKKKRANYSYIPVEVKKKVVAYANQHGIKPAGRLFNISEGTIRSWKLKSFDTENPMRNRGRKVTYGKELDEELYQHLMAVKREGRGVTIDQFSEYAKKMIDQNRPELNFKCSRGWVDKFFKRHNLRACKSENEKQKLANKLATSMSAFTSDFNSSNSSFNLATTTSGSQGTSSDSNGFEIVNPSCHVRDFDTNANNDFGVAVTVPAADRSELHHQYFSSESETLSGSAFIVYQGQNQGLDHPNKRKRTESGENDEEEEEEEEEENFHNLPGGDRGVEGDMTGNMLSGLEETTTATSSNENNKTSPDWTDAQSQQAHTQHIMSVIKSLDAESAKKHKQNFSLQQKQAVVKYALTNGSKNAERNFGIPESTIRSWVKKISFDGQEGNRERGLSSDALFASPRGASSAPPPPQAEAETDLYMLMGGSEEEAHILASALGRKQQGEEITFDKLCDQALSHISQKRPESAYSSTRKWVSQFLDLKVKDILNVANQK